MDEKKENVAASHDIRCLYLCCRSASTHNEIAGSVLRFHQRHCEANQDQGDEKDLDTAGLLEPTKVIIWRKGV